LFNITITDADDLKQSLSGDVTVCICHT